MYISENIKFLRELTQSSQRTFDRMIFPFYSIDTQITYKLENGRYSNPLPFLINIANFFHISLDKLIYRPITEKDLNKVPQERNMNYFYPNFIMVKKDNKFTLKDFAEYTNISINTITNYSRKCINYTIRLENLNSISTFLDCSFDELLSPPSKKQY